MKVQKMREEAAEKERDEYFNIIWLVIPIKKEWRVEEKDPLDNDEAPLIKDGSPPPTGMDINMVFTLLAEFRDVEEEVTQMCLGAKEAVFKKPEEWSQHLKSLYI
jgi:hypothetical protein